MTHKGLQFLQTIAWSCSFPQQAEYKYAACYMIHKLEKKFKTYKGQ